VCVNAEIRDAVCGLGVEAARLLVAPAYVGTAAPGGQAAGTLPEPIARWLADDRPRLLAVLFFRPEYGLDLLLEALACVRRRHPALGCLLLGGGGGEAEARAAVRAAGLAGRVRFGGDVEHALCRSLMARADLFVRPTRVDGDALSVREALALGVPVVASDAGFRPPGTLRFPRGDAGALAERIEQALASPRDAAPRAAAASAQVTGLDELARPYAGLLRGAEEGGRTWAPPCAG
jgi:glycosyltransferase involved in cell wall biosynthesis